MKNVPLTDAKEIYSTYDESIQEGNFQATAVFQLLGCIDWEKFFLNYPCTIDELRALFTNLSQLSIKALAESSSNANETCSDIQSIIENLAEIENAVSQHANKKITADDALSSVESFLNQIKGHLNGSYILGGRK